MSYPILLHFVGNAAWLDLGNAIDGLVVLVTTAAAAMKVSTDCETMACNTPERRHRRHRHRADA